VCGGGGYPVANSNNTQLFMMSTKRFLIFREHGDSWVRRVGIGGRVIGSMVGFINSKSIILL
jgi:hypothetical protein